MKKITLTMLFGLFVAFSFAQTIVSTTPENKNAILEEYTGINCSACPQGHTTAANIKTANPDDFYVINIHVGGYATPGVGQLDFRTEFGDALAGQSGLQFYPSGSINRHVFSGGATAMGREAWSNSVNLIKAETSYVNVAVEADVDLSTRTMTVHVEAYYTGDSPQSTNLLNVALLQNNTIGSQAGGSDNYNHMHRLVSLITGQWGYQISTTTTGTFVDQTFTYNIPLEYNGVFADLNEFEVVAFVAEDHQEIVTGSGAEVTTSGSLAQNDVALYGMSRSKGNCDGTIVPSVSIYNSGQSTINALEIEYYINSEATQTYNWTGTIDSGKNQVIELPVISFSLNDSNIVHASITNSDDDMSNNNLELSFTEEEFLPQSTEEIKVRILTDGYGYELNWNLINSSGVTVQSGGGDGTNGSTGAYGNGIDVYEDYTVPADCYTIELLDAYGDGGCALAIYQGNGSYVTHIQGSYGYGDTRSFAVNSTTSVENQIFSNVVVYPNPSEGLVTIKGADNLKVEIYNVLGNEVYESEMLSNDESLNLSNLSKGIYLIQLSSGEQKSTQKLILK